MRFFILGITLHTGKNIFSLNLLVEAVEDLGTADRNSSQGGKNGCVKVLVTFLKRKIKTATKNQHL